MEHQNKNLIISESYTAKVNEVIEASKNNIVAITGKEGCGKQTFLASIKDTINSNYNNNVNKNTKDQPKQCISLENVNSENFISLIVDNLFPDSKSEKNQEQTNENINKNDNITSTIFKNTKTLIKAPSYDNNKQVQFKKDLDAVINKMSETDYNKLQRKYTIISLVASVLASLGASIFILGCTNLRYLLDPESNLLDGPVGWGQTLGLIVPGILFIFISWFLFYLYYKNYKIEKNIPMNLNDQSKILNSLINNINEKESDFKKITVGIAKVLDIRSYFHFKNTFLKKPGEIVIIPTMFIINDFSYLNINEQLELLNAMWVLKDNKNIDFVLFLNDEDLNKLGDEQKKLLHKYIFNFFEIKYEPDTAKIILLDWLNKNYLPSDENCLWFFNARSDTKLKIYNDLENIFNAFANEINSYLVLNNFLYDLNNYFTNIGQYIKYISPMEIIIMFILKYSKQNIYDYLVNNGQNSLNISFNFKELNNPLALNKLNTSIIEQDRFIAEIIMQANYLSNIKAFTYIFNEIILDQSTSNINSKLYKRFYSIHYNFNLFLHLDQFLANLKSYLDKVINQPFYSIDNLFQLLFDSNQFDLMVNSAIFDLTLIKNLVPSQVIEFVHNKAKLFLNENELCTIFDRNTNKIFNFKYYEAVLVKLYTLAIIINEDLLVNELKDFNSLIPLLNNKEEVDNEFKKLLLNNPQLFYTIYLMNICIDIDSNFFLYNFQFNIIDKKYIDLYQYLTNQNTYNLMIELIKNTSINWSLDFNWKKYGFVWLQYYLLNTKDDVDINQMIDINNKIHDYHIITFILMNYSNFIIVPKIIPFKNIEVLHKEKFHLNELIKNDVTDIFKNEVINNKLQLKIGEVYYQYDLYTNKISHIYALDLYESYGALE